MLKPSNCECFLTGVYGENHWVDSNCKIPNIKWHLRRDLSKEKETDFNKGICHLNHGKLLSDLKPNYKFSNLQKEKVKRSLLTGT